MTGPSPTKRVVPAAAVTIALAILLVGPARSRTLDLPVRVVGGPEVKAPAYFGDRLSLRLTPWAARQASARRDRSGLLGLSALDATARSLGGVWFEPEFKGEVPPPEGSGRVDFTTFYLAHLPAGADLAGAQDAFASLAEVENAEPIGIAPVSAVPNDSLWAISDWFYNPPSRRDVHAPEAWDITTGDTSIVVAIVDTGLMPYHPDLGGREPGLPGQVWTNWAERGGLTGVDDDHNGFVDDVWGWDFVNLPPGSGVRPGEDGFDEEGDPNDFVGHGTAVAGIVGAIANNGSGVAGTVWNTRLMALRVGWSSTEQPSGDVSMSFAAQAIRYATRMGARVVNCSFSNTASYELAVAIADATSEGVLVVFGSGNYGSPNIVGPRPDVLTVGAVDHDDVVAPWSNNAPWVDLCAPGTAVATTAIKRPGTDSLGYRQPSYVPDAGGTSFACPFVVGAAALVQARRLALGRPLLDPMTMVLHLRETADDIRSQNPFIDGFGTGRLNLERAVANAGTPASRVVRTPGRIVGAPVSLPRAGQFDRVAMVTDDGKLLIIDDATGATVRLITLPGKPIAGLSAADLGGGYGTAMFVPLDGGKVAGYYTGGDPLPGWPVTPINDPGGYQYGLALGDLDGDGTLEVVGARPGGVHVFRANGQSLFRWLVPFADDVTAGVALADLDGVPGMEVIVVGRLHLVYALRADGSDLPRWPVGLPHGLYPPAAPVVTRFGNESAPTVIVADGTNLSAIRADGSLRFQRPLWDYTPLDPALADLNGDGSDDVVVASGSNLAAFDSTGAIIWSPRSPYRPFTQDMPVVGFLRGTSEPAVILRTALELTAFDRTGRVVTGYPKPGAAGAYPVLRNRAGGQAAELLAGTDADSLFYLYDLGAGSWSALPQPWPTPRGNPARTGSHLGESSITPSDSIAPSPVTDLAAARSGLGIDLTWTAPADDGVPPRAASYELRWSSSPLDETNIESAQPVVGLPVPSAAGQPERFRITGFAESQQYYFALRSRDAGWNLSALSNPAPVLVPPIPPARIGDLRGHVDRDSSVALEWTAVGDDSLIGRVQRYQIGAAPQLFDESGFDGAPIRPVAAAVGDPGTTEHFTLTGLPIRQPLWIALEAEDDLGLASPMSNLISVPAPLVRPARVSDLRITTTTDGGIELRWTAVGDDSLLGLPVRYELRAATQPLDEVNFSSAPIARDITSVLDPGQSHVHLLSGLTLGQPLWIGIEAVDDLELRSALSNVVPATFTGTPPDAVSDLSVEASVDSGVVLRWSETGDDGRVGRASRYLLAADPAVLTQARFDSAEFRLEVERGARGLQRVSFAGLAPGQVFSFALEAVDDIGARSLISNVLSAGIGLVRPAPVTDLMVLANTDSTLTVGWSASGDDSLRGRPARYHLRASREPIDDSTFDGAAFAEESAPSVDAGKAELGTFHQLPVSEPLYLAIEAEDDLGQRSALSNVISTAINPHPPGSVSDLAIESASENGISLRWTASGDDGTVGQCQEYLLRAGPDSLTDTNFATAPIAVTIPATVPSGLLEHGRIGGVSIGEKLFLAIKARDRVGALSRLSNVASITVVAEAPQAVGDLRIEATGDSNATLRWTATGDDGRIGRPRVYELRAAAQPFGEEGFATAAFAREVAATVDAGGVERFEFGGLPSGRRWWFALKAVDAVGTVSTISNLASGRVGIGGPLHGRSGAGLAALQQPSRSPVSLYWQADEAGERATHTVELFDLNGRCVRRYSVGPGVGGVVTWDGRSERGERLSAGLYFARMADGAPGTQARIVLLP